MTASPPPWNPAPDRRRRLQQQYEQAQRLAQQPQPDENRIRAILAECIREDPGCVLYLEAFLASVQRQKPVRSWLARFWPWAGAGKESAKREGVEAQNAHALLSGAATTLLQSPLDHQAIARLASAAGELDFDQAELWYWRLGTTLAPQDANIWSGYAQALTWQGRFVETVQAWREVLAISPHDSCAEQMLANVTDTSGGEEQFAAEEQALHEAQARGASPLDILERRENLQLQRARHRSAVAERVAAANPHPRAHELVARLHSEQMHVEVEVLHVRCERLPQNAECRLELARALKRAKNFSAAIQRLEEAGKLLADAGLVRLELGECWQHLRQFEKALAYFERAADVEESENGAERENVRQTALYRAAVLAQAMGDTPKATRRFEQLVAANPDFKDAKLRLDKLLAS